MEETTKDLSQDLVVGASPLAELPTLLRGHKLVVLRALWVAVSIATVSLYIVVSPWIFGGLRYDFRSATIWDRALMSLYFTLPWIYLAVAAIIFWLKSNDWMALFVSLTLMTFGVVLATFDSAISIRLLYGQAIWHVLFIGVRTIGWGSFLLFFLLFPNGRFGPNWTRWLAVGWFIYILLWIPFPALNLDARDGNLGILLVLGCLITGMLAQVYRYRRVSSSVERQQTKWVMFGCTAAGVGAIIVATIFLAGTLVEAGKVESSILGPLEDYLWYILISVLMLAILLVR